MTTALESDHYVTHTAFGLRYRSRLPWLPAPRIGGVEQPFDVEVTVGAALPPRTPEEMPGPQFEGSPGRLLFRTRTIADFLVEEGAQVHINPMWGVEPLKLWNLLFGGVTGALLIQRGVLALHGSSVEIPGGAVLFCGASGAGKSTLAGLLLRQGFRVLDDNIAALYPGDGGFRVQPGLGHFRFTHDTLRLLGESARGAAFPAPVEPKHLHQLRPEEFCPEPRPLRHIFLLDRNRETQWDELRGKEKLDVLQSHLFVRHMVEPLGRLKSHFQGCLDLAGAVPLSRVGASPGLGPEGWSERIAGRIRLL